MFREDALICAGSITYTDARDIWDAVSPKSAADRHSTLLEEGIVEGGPAAHFVRVSAKVLESVQTCTVDQHICVGGHG